MLMVIILWIEWIFILIGAMAYPKGIFLGHRPFPALLRSSLSIFSKPEFDGIS